MTRTVALLGAFDTKGEDFAFVKRRIERNGFATLMIDFGVLGTPTIAADITRVEVAAAAGFRLEDLVARHDRGEAITVVTQGTASHLLRLFGDGRIDAVMAMGGGAGTTVGTAVMRQLPIGFPKMMVSTLAAATSMQPYIGTSDIIMVPSVVDVAGLNRISRMIYTRAADALCGMLNWPDERQDDATDRPLVATTMFGMTTPCVSHARDRLTAADIEVLVFHANGGGRAMEHLIDDGLVDGVLDLTTTEWADELVGGTRSAGPRRLEAAARRGLPQVVSVGALDAVNFGARETVPERFAQRRFYQHNAQTTLMRTSPEEAAGLGRIIAGKLNAATGPVVLLLPLRGISNLDAEGEPFEDVEADKALFASLHRHADPTVVTVRDVDLHINDPAFAEFAVDTLLRLMAEHPRRSPAAPRAS
jgi:uncharacterized protein (UPF0261 family)